MSDMTSGGMACPGCAATGLAGQRGSTAMGDTMETILSVPGVHCALCISTLESGLSRLPGVALARVNLTLRRVRIRHDARADEGSLIAALGRLGYEALPLDMVTLASTDHDRAGRDLTMRLSLAFFAMMNIMLLSVAVWSGATNATRDMFHLLSALIALPTVAIAGQPFFRSAARSLRAGRLGMDVPISLALILACGISLFETVEGGDKAFFDAAVMLCFFLLAGRLLDHRARAAARSAAQELAALDVPRALRLTDDPKAEPEIVPASALVPGDRVVLRPGTRAPADGTVTEGLSELDVSWLTGETDLAAAGPGTVLSAGTINRTRRLVMQVTAAGPDTTLARITRAVAMAEDSRNRYTSLADRAARLYSPLVHLLSFTAFGVWMWRTGGDVRQAVNISAAVLIITCPCALGLAVPAVVTAASGRLFRRGLLIKSATALERLAEVDFVVLDKTGTLTMGQPEPGNLSERSGDERALAAALARGSSHPLAMALAAAIPVPEGGDPQVEGLAEVPGRGLTATWAGQTVRLGRADWVGAPEASVTATWLRIGSAAPVPFTFADRLRPGAEELVRRLTARGLRLRLLSGDVPGAVGALADRLGIADWHARQSPEVKLAHVTALAEAGRHVLMIGDGLNDTAALAAAHVSISPASALDAARVASDIVLIGNDLTPVASALDTARQAIRRMRENFAISAAYNVIAVPVALVGLATPLLAALAMSLSSLTVILNALRLGDGEGRPWKS